MIDISKPVLIGTLIFLFLCSAFFSGSETAMMRINRYKLRHKANHSKIAKHVYDLVSQPDRLLGVILIGNTFANILSSSIATLLFSDLFGQEMGVLIASLGLTFLLLLFGEIMPKTVGALNPEKVASIVVLPLKAMLALLYPLVSLMNWLSQLFLQLLKVAPPKAGQDALNRDELRMVVSEAGSLIPKRHQRMLLGILDLENATIDDIMIPRAEVIGINLEDEWEDIERQITTSPHTVIPAYKEDLNNIVGILHLRDALHVMANEKLDETELLKILTPPYFIPEGTPLHQQLYYFQRNKARLGLVVDEYGDITGLVTLADILEEIVGEFTTDLSVAHKEIYPQPDGSYVVDGSIHLRVLNRQLKLNLPVKKAKTLSGLITDYLQAMPQSATCIIIEKHPIEIVQVAENKVKIAKIFPQIIVESSLGK